jgi:hypothetical protein
MLPVDEDHVDGKCHTDGVNRLRGYDEQPASSLKRPLAEQTDHAPHAGVGNSDLLTQAGTSGRVVDTGHFAIPSQALSRLLSAGRAALSALNEDKQHHHEQNA